MLHNVPEGRPGRRQLPLRTALKLRHRQNQVSRLVAVLIDLATLHRLRTAGHNVPAKFAQRLQSLAHSLDLCVFFIAPPLLQGLKQRIHFTFGLLILNGQQHPGLEIHQMRRHNDKFAGHLQIHFLSLLQPHNVLVADQGNGNILYFQLIFPQKKQNQIQRAFKILHLLRPGVNHLFQFEYRTFQNRYLSIKMLNSTSYTR